MLCVALATFAANICSGSTVQIHEIGLQGYFSFEPLPTRVQLLLTNTDHQTQEMTIEIHAFDKSDPRATENVFHVSVKLAAGEERSIDVPVLIPDVRTPFLEAEARSASGVLVGKDWRDLGRPFTSGPVQFSSLVAIVCLGQPVCQRTQSAISFSGSVGQQTQKQRSLNFISVHDPPANWWAYSAARVVVLAAPLAQLSSEQQSALEDYARFGGKLILAEDEMADTKFLAPYRTGPLTPGAIVVGSGCLYRTGKVDGSEMKTLFSEPRGLSVAESGPWIPYRNDELSWLIRRLAATFRFPELRWVLLFVATYIFVIGFLNFAVLKRLDKREWGWVTVPLIAIVCALLLYAWSASRGPRTYEIDEISVFSMDDQSSRAASDTALRISSPRRAQLTLDIASEPIFNGKGKSLSFVSSDTFLEMGVVRGSERRWNVYLGQPWRGDLTLRQWSFEDLEFHDLKVLPGTIRRAGEARLRNDTGQAFSQAMYVEKNKVYLLGAVAPGAELDLTSAQQQPLSTLTGRVFANTSQYPATLGTGTGTGIGVIQSPSQTDAAMEYFGEWRQLPYQSFHLAELIRGWPKDGGHVFATRSGVFFGLSEGSPFQAGLTGVAITRKSYTLTIVSFAPYHD